MTKRYILNSYQSESDKRSKTDQNQALAEDLGLIQSAVANAGSANQPALLHLHAQNSVSSNSNDLQPSNESNTSSSSDGIRGDNNLEGQQATRNWLSGVVRRHPRVGSSFQAITLPPPPPYSEQIDRSDWSYVTP